MSWKAPALIAVLLRVTTSTWSARIRVESGISALATTTGPVVTTAGGWLPPCGFCASRITPTNATMARNTPINKTSRLERFKSILPATV